MPKPIKLKSAPTDAAVSTYIDTLPTSAQADATALYSLFKTVTGVNGTMWGPSIVGFGEYEYTRSNGDFGTFLATGFSIRKSGPTLYILPGYTDYSELLDQLGPHKLGKCCLYIKRLSDVNQSVLKKLIAAGLRDLKKSHSVKMR